MRSWIALALVIALLSGALGGLSVARAQVDPGFVLGEKVVVNTDSLSFRADPTLNASVLAVLIDGTLGTVVGGPVTADGFVWYQLDVDGTLGWGAADFLQPAASSEGLLPAGTIAVSVTDTLNLRANPGLEADTVTELANGATAAVLHGPQSADGFDWYQIFADGTVGWAARDFLAFAPADVTTLAVGDRAIVNTDALILRATAGLTGSEQAVLTGGDEVVIVGGPVQADGFTWFEVDTAAGNGWVAGQFLLI
jgi:uncharacterized protein YraI